MVDVPSHEETTGLAVVLTVVGLMSWHWTDSVALHSRLATVALSLALAGVVGLALLRWTS